MDLAAGSVAAVVGLLPAVFALLAAGNSVDPDPRIAGWSRPVGAIAAQDPARFPA